MVGTLIKTNFITNKVKITFFPNFGQGPFPKFAGKSPEIITCDPSVCTMENRNCITSKLTDNTICQEKVNTNIRYVSEL